MTLDPLDRVLACAAESDDVLLYRQARRLGLSRREIDYLHWMNAQPVVRGAIAVPPIRNPLRTAARAAQMSMPHGVISHATAAHIHRLQGIGFWESDHVVHLTFPSSRTRKQRRGARLHFRDLRADEVIEIDGLWVTTVLRTLADCALEADRVAFVSIVDSSLNQRLLLSHQIEKLDDALRRNRCAKAAGWLSLVDGRAESPSETRVRIVLTDGGLPPDSLQRRVFNKGGYLLARLDIAYERHNRRVGMEVDSAEHERPRALYRDRTKHNAMPSLGWDVRHVTARDALRKPWYVIGQAKDALGLK